METDSASISNNEEVKDDQDLIDDVSGSQDGEFGQEEDNKGDNSQEDEGNEISVGANSQNDESQEDEGSQDYDDGDASEEEDSEDQHGEYVSMLVNEPRCQVRNLS